MDGKVWGIMAGLAAFSFVTSLFIGVQLPAGAALPVPGIPQEPRGPAMMLLSALPWILAGGMLGPISAAAVGFFAGVLRFLWDTNSLFTPLEFALLAASFSVLVRQRYRTATFRLTREPMIATIVAAIIFIPLYIFDAYLLATGEMATRLDYALASFQSATLATAGELLIAGLFAQAIAMAFPGPWGRRLPLQPSPAERSLEARFLFGTGTLIFLLLFALLIGDWVVAGNAARNMLENRLRGTAELTAQSVPFFLETGQNLAMQVSQKPEVSSGIGQGLNDALGDAMRSVPYFDQFIVLDKDHNILGYYPYINVTPEQLRLYTEETAGLELSFNGVLSQTYTIPPINNGQPARVSFVIAIFDPATAQSNRVLIGRTSLDTNPFTQPLINSLQSIVQMNGAGILLDENGRILYHPNPGQVMTKYAGRVAETPMFFDDPAPDGTRNIVFFQPAVGRPWAVVLSIPAQESQQLALTIAAPLSAMILALAVIALVSLRLGLKVVTVSLQTLASEAMRIAQGNLDNPLQVDGVDEVGQLRRSFEQMRASLQARLEELNRLLLVSQGVASSLEMGDAVQSVLEAVLATGANAVRVVMSPNLTRNTERDIPPIYALGPARDRYAYLDTQITTMSQQQDRLVLTNVSRARGLELDGSRPYPASLLAIPLRHENQYFGVMWAAYEQPRLFSESDVRFLTTLAGQAALAAANNHLFLSAEVGRQRLASILASTPDPVLVTDHLNRLLLANPAAWQVLGAAVGAGEGQPIEKLVSQKPLLEILEGSSAEKKSAEVVMPNGLVYLATASSVVADGRPVGRVCILRDVTHFKELDTMKTEFVNTVSHDLRSPLTLMRGYATMLEMVGELNEQQQTYVKKIIIGVENMARLVNNLLDLGRIDVGVGLQLETIPLIDIVEKVIGQLQLQATQKNIELNVETPKDTVPLIEADQTLLYQAMYNLVENAIKYTPQHGKISVRMKLVDDYMLFEVQDTGIGIAPIDQSRLFEKFYRGGQREAREQKGSGLGLAIVKSIAERHGGKVWLESQLGKGSTFFLNVPLHQPRENKN